MKTSEPRVYTITVTETQLGHLRDACELLARCRIGQIDAACREVLDEHGRAAVPYDAAKQAEDLVKASIGLSPNGSWGVGKHGTADIPWDMYQVFRHRLAWDQAYEEGIIQPGAKRDYYSMMGVSYDPPMQHGAEPLPIINGKQPPVNEVM